MSSVGNISITHVPHDYSKNISDSEHSEDDFVTISSSSSSDEEQRESSPKTKKKSMSYSAKHVEQMFKTFTDHNLKQDEEIAFLKRSHNSSEQKINALTLENNELKSKVQILTETIHRFSKQLTEKDKEIDSLKKKEIQLQNENVLKGKDIKNLRGQLRQSINQGKTEFLILLEVEDQKKALENELKMQEKAHNQRILEERKIARDLALKNGMLFLENQKLIQSQTIKNNETEKTKSLPNSFTQFFNSLLN